MRDLHTFGPARRARRVDHVRQVSRARSAIEIRHALLVAGRAFRVEADDACFANWQLVAQPLFGEQNRDLRVLEHECDPLGRIRWVERYVGSPGLENGQEPHHSLRRPPGAEPHQNLGADPHGAEASCQAIGTSIELGVGERYAGRDDARRPPACGWACSSIKRWTHRSFAGDRRVTSCGRAAAASLRRLGQRGTWLR